MKKYNVELLFVLLSVLALPFIFILEQGREFFLIAFCFVSSFIIFFTTRGEESKKLIFCYLFIIIYLIVSYFNILNLPILVGPDEERFYEGLLNYRNNYDLYVGNTLEHIKNSYIVFSSSYPVFGLLMNPFMDFYSTSGPEISIAINFILLLITILLFKNIINNKVHSNYWLFIILCLPSFNYHSSIFAKDIVSLFMVFLSLYFFVNRSFFLFFIVLIFSIALRPYSFVIVAIYFLFIRDELKLLGLGAFLSLLLVAFVTGFIGMINTVFTSVYLIVSPNPFGAELRPDYLPLYIESILFFIAYVISLYFNLKSKSFRLFLLFHFSLVVYASIMVVMAFYGSISYDFDYGIGQMGGNVVRKKLPIIPLVLVYFYFSINRKQRHLLQLN